MILKNSKGKEKEFKLLFELEKDKNKYIVYKDEKTNNIYAGKQKKDDLCKIDESEYDFLNKVLEKMKV